MSRWPHLARCPDNFEDFADVFFVLGDQRLPVHSQYLASHSKLMQNMMREAPGFSKDRPLVLDRQLEAFAPNDLQLFLNHIYLSPAISAVPEAHALVQLADLFDAGQLMHKAVEYLEEASADELFSSKDTILHWLLLAERYRLTALMAKCANQAAFHFSEVK